MPAPLDAPLEDPLTGLSNRRHFDVLFDFAFQLAGRGVALTLVMLEIRSLDELRERSGEGPVDQVLSTFGRVLASTTRATDVAARVDDARFVAMLMHCNVHGGVVYADRAREGFEDTRREQDLSLCAGVAAFAEEMKTPAELLALGDRVLQLSIAAEGERIATPEDLAAAG